MLLCIKCSCSKLSLMSLSLGHCFNMRFLFSCYMGECWQCWLLLPHTLQDAQASDGQKLSKVVPMSMPTLGTNSESLNNSPNTLGTSKLSLTPTKRGPIAETQHNKQSTYRAALARIRAAGRGTTWSPHYRVLLVTIYVRPCLSSQATAKRWCCLQ